MGKNLVCLIWFLHFWNSKTFTYIIFWNIRIFGPLKAWRKQFKKTVSRIYHEKVNFSKLFGLGPGPFPTIRNMSFAFSLSWIVAIWSDTLCQIWYQVRHTFVKFAFVHLIWYGLKLHICFKKIRPETCYSAKK